MISYVFSPLKNRTYKVIDPASRFWEKVEIVKGCWEWTAAKTQKGYGDFNAGKGLGHITAHRFSWIIHNGPIPDGLFVRHKCDNPPCVRPDHLELGTVQDNSNDMVVRGRSPKGEKHPMAKLTPLEVLEIRNLHAEGVSMKSLARIYRVAYSHIHKIIKRTTWRHI